jgi:hypothetical protein
VKDKPVIVTKIFGGLGNQMFQYAAAKSLAASTGAQLKLDRSSFDDQIRLETPRQWGLHVFKNISEEHCSAAELQQMGIPKDNSIRTKIYKHLVKKFSWINKHHVLESSTFYHPISFSGSDLFLEGYWQSPEYFSFHKELITHQFNLDYMREEQSLVPLITDIEKSNSISIHVRRGDYVHDTATKKVHFVCDENYYYASIAGIVKKVPEPVKFFIFSDDIEWCRKNLVIKQEHEFVDTGQESADLFLMSICKHNIIANSTFSWWAAWLNTNIHKIVVAPVKWHNLQKRNNTRLLLEGWIKIA